MRTQRNLPRKGKHPKLLTVVSLRGGQKNSHLTVAQLTSSSFPDSSGVDVRRWSAKVLSRRGHCDPRDEVHEHQSLENGPLALGWRSNSDVFWAPGWLGEGQWARDCQCVRAGRISRTVCLHAGTHSAKSSKKQSLSISFGRVRGDGGSLTGQTHK